jgi:hypothetical protein
MFLLRQSIEIASFTAADKEKIVKAENQGKGLPAIR